jgi:hypothetical protein
MTAATDHLGTLRGALSDWLYDPRHTTAPHEAQAAHADAIEAALAECEREGMGDVGRDLSRGHGWEDTAACWAWRLPGWDAADPMVAREVNTNAYGWCKHYTMNGVLVEYSGVGQWVLIFKKLSVALDWWDHILFPNQNSALRWTIERQGTKQGLKSPEGLALLDTVRPKVTL